MVPSKYWLRASPYIFCNHHLFLPGLPSHLDSCVPAPIASEECTSRSWFWVHRVMPRGFMMVARGQSSHLCGQVTRDWGEQALSVDVPGSGSAPPQLHSGLCKTPEAHTQAREDQVRRERPAWLILLSLLAEWDTRWGAGWEEGLRIQMKFSWENFKWFCFSLYTSRLSREIYTCNKNTALFFP